MIAEFAAEYQREFNNLIRESQSKRTAQSRELNDIERKIDQLVDAITAGMFHESMKQRLTDLETKKAKLEEFLSEPEVPPVLIHPGTAEAYKRRVVELIDALDETTEASMMSRRSSAA